MVKVNQKFGDAILSGFACAVILLILYELNKKKLP